MLGLDSLLRVVLRFLLVNSESRFETTEDSLAVVDDDDEDGAGRLALLPMKRFCLPPNDGSFVEGFLTTLGLGDGFDPLDSTDEDPRDTEDVLSGTPSLFPPPSESDRDNGLLLLR